MRIREVITESDYVNTNLPLGNYRGPYDPRTMQPYPAQYADSAELIDAVEELIDDGFEPKVVTVNPAELTATQDWLSNYPGDGPLFPDYPDRPVVLRDGPHYYILDGHHRSAAALKSNRPISIYLFDELE